GENPRAKPGVFAEARRRLADLDPRVLKKVLGRIAIARETAKEAEDRDPKSRIELVECPRLLRAQTRHQPPLFRRRTVGALEDFAVAGGHGLPNLRGNASRPSFVTLFCATRFPVTIGSSVTLRRSTAQP